MSYEACLCAMNLEMPDHVPRTEFSLEMHTPLLRKVSGLPLPEGDAQMRKKAIEILHREWDFSFMWATDLGNQYYGDMFTDMGHAIYDENGKDWNANTFCPFTNTQEVLDFEPAVHFCLPSKAELTAEFNAHYLERSSQEPRQVAMVGSYTTGMSGMISIFGWEMLLEAAGDDYDRFGAMLQRYGDWLMPYYEAMAASDSPNVMIHDDMVWASGGFMPPEWYREFLFPLYKRYLAPLKEVGKKITFTSDGNFTQYIPDLVDCGFDGFVLEPLTDMKVLAEQYGKTHYFIGNADTRILLYGTKEDIYGEVKRCFDTAKACPGFIFATGNHIPPNTPLENCLWYNEFYMQMRRR